MKMSSSFRKRKKKKKGRTGELEAAPETDTSGDTEEFSRSLD
jgi:hypothetical protein